MSKEISLVLVGEAGQGIKTIELLMAELLKKRGHHYYISREYMSRVRGGINSTQIVISDKPVNSFRKRTDLLIALTDEPLTRYEPRISKKTDVIASGIFTEIAKKHGNLKFANSVVFGYICAMIGEPDAEGADMLRQKFKEYPEMMDGNLNSYNEGYSIFKGKQTIFKAFKEGFIHADGSLAAAYGVIFGGCNFVSAYPMSPSTAVLTNLAELSDRYGILVEQAEDEIAAINMAIGASYAGARALVTTSGGGFALMCEGLSLAGATETPVVVHIGQRPGPATGLPTRTEQGDFNLALYAGHGDFQRVILAPGDQAQAIRLSMEAFNISQEYQIPVIILTDQYMLDSVKPILKTKIPEPEARIFTVSAKNGYARYKYTTDGISPRAIPGIGVGAVCADSDEHDEYGRITEDAKTRKQMVEKRNKRLSMLESTAIMPELIGAEDYGKLYVCYGSNLGVAYDLKNECEKHGCAFLHFSQLYPLSDKAGEYLKKAKSITVIENNYTGQFADYLEKRFALSITDRLLKYNGDPFSYEEILKKIRGGHK